MAGLVFGKAIETRHGNFAAGDPLPIEWGTRETRRQLIEQFGEDVLVQAQTVSNESMSARLSAIERSLEEIKTALGIKMGAKAKSTDKGKATSRA